MSDIEERPVHSELNLTTGEEIHTPVTDEEWADMKAREAQALLDEAEKAKEDAALREAVAAHPDPIVQELARRLGLM